MINPQNPEQPIVLPEPIEHLGEEQTEQKPDELIDTPEDELIDDSANTLGEDPLIPINELVSNMAQFIGQMGDPEMGQVLTVEQLSFDMPIELRMELDQEGRLVLNTAPPTQQIETTFMPVFHQIKLSVVKDNEW